MNLTARQCRSARGLLKWNIHDLASRTSVLHKRIESFERGSIKLHKPENEEIIKLFQKQGIEFKENFEVDLSDNRNKDSSMQAINSGGGGQNLGQAIVIDADYMESESGKPLNEEEKKKNKRPAPR